MLGLTTPIVESITGLRASSKSSRIFSYLVPLVAQASEATDPRDMIYGLQGLLNLDLEVNYGKTVRQVYLDWHAKVIAPTLENGEVEVDLVSRAGIGLYEENEHNLPSWLPNLICDRVTRTALPTDELERYNQSLSEIGVDYLLYMKERDHPASIRPLQALYYTVHRGIDPYTGQRFPPELNPQSGAAQVFRNFCAFDLPTTTTGHDWSYVDLEAAGDFVAYLETRLRGCGDAVGTERRRRAPADMSLDGRQAQVMGAMVRWASVFNKAVFYTVRGYIGIGPRYTHVGDRLCVIDNCSLPVLLRMEGSARRLVGAAYAYGLSETQPRETIQSCGFREKDW
ncbi:hypothetical protein DL762_009376 [Monosporascus cannonballus]|uniref:Uncharacterized protein n=1 Tax=Monosporascus cannonballus TaxID=155416 RepID=A0ABY0GTU9_9PEZI|nr:hypothetical protein DL762_009376 [Monosporascus cannonballus]